MLINLLAAQGLITGTVTDASDGTALMGATIKVGDQGTITDDQGHYQMNITDHKGTLLVSYVGYRQYAIKLVANQNIYDVALSPDDQLLETIVITGSKYEQKISESVVSIDVLRPQIIQQSNTNNIEGIFNKIPGVQMIDGQPNIRGGSGWSYNAGNRVMLLIDDMPALQVDAGRASWVDIPTEIIDQIEVIKGAGSTLYGSAAMNGVINIRTAYATSKPETHVSLFGTAYNDYADGRKNWFRRDPVSRTPTDFGLAISHKQQYGKLDMVTAVYHYSQDSTRSFRQEDFESKSRASLGLRYRATDRLTFGINTVTNFGKSSSFFLWKNGSTGALQPLSGTVSKSENTRFNIDPFLTYFDSNYGKHSIKSRFYSVHNDNNLNQSNSSTMRYLEYQYQRDYGNKWIGNIGGVWNYGTSDSELFRSAEINQTNLAAYIQMTHQPSEKIRLTGGLRYEYNSQYNGTINHTTVQIPEGSKSEDRVIGRLGLNYSLSGSTFLRASLGQAYRFPIMIERFLSTEFSGFVVLPNPDLDSEDGVTMEIGIKQGLRSNFFKGYIDMAVFDSRYRNMMEFVFVNEPTFGFQSHNIGDTQISGFEISTGGQLHLLGLDMNVYGGYNFINPSYQEFDELKDFIESTSTSDDNVLKYRSRHSYTLDIQTQLGQWSVGASCQGQSNMVAIDAVLNTFLADLASYRSLHDKGYYTIDTRMARQFDPLTVSLHIKNILNREVMPRPGIIDAPRNIALRLDWAIQ